MPYTILSYHYEKQKHRKSSLHLAIQNLDAQYQTNPNGAGVKKTITVDGDISDWDESMIIAQGAANDDPRVYMHAAMHENPADQSYSKDPSTTREKEDAYNITVPFAYIGKSL